MAGGAASYGRRGRGSAAAWRNAASLLAGRPLAGLGTRSTAHADLHRIRLHEPGDDLPGPRARTVVVITTGEGVAGRHNGSDRACCIAGLIRMADGAAWT